MSVTEACEKPEAPRRGGLLDRAVDGVDRVSERISIVMFRFGIYVTMPVLVVLVTLVTLTIVRWLTTASKYAAPASTT